MCTLRLAGASASAGSGRGIPDGFLAVDVLAARRAEQVRDVGVVRDRHPGILPDPVGVPERGRAAARAASVVDLRLDARRPARPPRSRRAEQATPLADRAREPRATVFGSVTSTSMPASRSASTSSRRFSSALAKTRSGFRSRIRAMSGLLVPPTRGSPQSMPARPRAVARHAGERLQAPDRDDRLGDRRAEGNHPLRRHGTKSILGNRFGLHYSASLDVAARDLALLLRSRHPLVVCETVEEQRFEALVRVVSSEPDHAPLDLERRERPRARPSRRRREVGRPGRSPCGRSAQTTRRRHLAPQGSDGAPRGARDAAAPAGDRAGVRRAPRARSSWSGRRCPTKPELEDIAGPLRVRAARRRRAARPAQARRPAPAPRDPVGAGRALAARTPRASSRTCRA